MDHTTRTIVFGVLAVVAVSMGFATSIWTRPPSPDELTDEGQEFYPEFTNAFDARAIEVVVYNRDIGSAEKFRVEYQDGVWRIPTHYNYPADAQDQLAKTANSVIGLVRESLQSTSAEDHEELGVVDPLNDQIASSKGRGTRIRLLDANEQSLVDFIIGKQEGRRHYVRRDGEDRTYLVDLGVFEVSTKLTDWIEPNLLDVQRNDIVELFVNDYTVVESVTNEGLEFVPQENEIALLTRESGGFEWDLAGLDQATQQVKSSVVNAMLTAIDDLEIVGVRPKPSHLDAVLRGEVGVGRGEMTLIMNTLLAKGYYLLPDPELGAYGLYSKEGSLFVGTDEGVRYELLVGNVFIGSQNEIEIGGESDAPAETAEPVAETESAEADAAEPTEEELAPGEQRSRYLFILASFDETLLGPRPEPPVMPTPPGEAPEESEAAPSESAADDSGEAGDLPSITPGEPSGDEANTDAATPTEPSAPETESSDNEEAPPCDDTPVTDDTAADPPAETEPASETESSSEEAPATDAPPAETDAAEAPPAPSPEELQAAYESAVRDYEIALERYEQELRAYDERVEAGQKKVAELQARFADWYYVIPADVFEDLDVSRADLIEPLPEDTAPSAGDTPGFEFPGLPMLDFPGSGAPPTESTDPEMTPETTEPQPDAPADSAPQPEAPESPQPEAEASQSSESADSPTATPDSTDGPSTIETEPESELESPTTEESTPEAP